MIEVVVMETVVDIEVEGVITVVVGGTIVIEIEMMIVVAVHQGTEMMTETVVTGDAEVEVEGAVPVVLLTGTEAVVVHLEGTVMTTEGVAVAAIEMIRVTIAGMIAIIVTVDVIMMHVGINKQTSSFSISDKSTLLFIH